MFGIAAAPLYHGCVAKWLDKPAMRIGFVGFVSQDLCIVYLLDTPVMPVVRIGCGGVLWIGCVSEDGVHDIRLPSRTKTIQVWAGTQKKLIAFFEAKEENNWHWRRIRYS